MLIGADATINTAWLAATTLDIDPAKFMQGGALGCHVGLDAGRRQDHQ